MTLRDVSDLELAALLAVLAAQHSFADDAGCGWVNVGAIGALQKEIKDRVAGEPPAGPLFPVTQGNRVGLEKHLARVHSALELVGLPHAGAFLLEAARQELGFEIAVERPAIH